MSRLLEYFVETSHILDTSLNSTEMGHHKHFKIFNALSTLKQLVFQSSRDIKCVTLPINLIKYVLQFSQ